VSVITSISYDHTTQLGPTLSDIATEKSGIIKYGVPIVTTVRHPEPLNVIRKHAQSLDSPLFVLDEHFCVQQKQSVASQYTFRYDARLPEFPVELSLDDISLKMPGTHQIVNASAAISAFLLLNQNDKTFDTKKIRLGLRKAFMPLRMEIIRHSEESPTFIFDGAHNRASMQAFIQTVEEMFPTRRLLLIFGASLEKDVAGMFTEIAGRFQHVFLTQASESSRRFPPKELRSIFALPDASVTVVENCQDAWKQCIQMADKEDVICITGSLYLAAELRK
jgi:dihydrofolate synthase/folylpolyglutamate synthase